LRELRLTIYMLIHPRLTPYVGLRASDLPTPAHFTVPSPPHFHGVRRGKGQWGWGRGMEGQEEERRGGEIDRMIRRDGEGNGWEGSADDCFY
jgi:hypothetical protein